MSARGSRSEVGFAAALQHDLSVFQPGIMPAGEVIERADGSRLSVHFLGEVPPGEVFKTRRGNTIARAGHGRVVLLGGLHELDATVFAEEATQAGPSIAESLPGAIWTDEPQEVVLEQAKQFLAEARRAEAAAAAEVSPEGQMAEHARALRLYEAAHVPSNPHPHPHPHPNPRPQPHPNPNPRQGWPTNTGCWGFSLSFVTRARVAPTCASTLGLGLVLG